MEIPNHLIETLWYEYPALPIPHNFHILSRVACSGTYQPSADQHDIKCSHGLVVGFYQDQMLDWLCQQLSFIALPETVLRPIIDELENLPAEEEPSSPLPVEPILNQPQSSEKERKAV